MRSRSVALVEDSEDDAEMFVEAANRAAEGIEIVRFDAASSLFGALEGGDLVPSLVVTDARLPDATAVEVIERVVGRPGAVWTPVVVMSGLADPDIIRDCYAKGASGFVIKPAGFGELCEMVGTLCRYWVDTIALPGG